jgi:hypothetical protein
MTGTLLKRLRGKLPRNYHRQFHSKPRPVSIRTLRGAISGEVTDPVKILLVKETLEEMIAENRKIYESLKSRKPSAKKSLVK